MPVEVSVPVSKVYIPYGFDSKDAVEVVVAGYLPNLCYKYPKFSVTQKGNTIAIDASALHYGVVDESNGFCTEVIQPFTETISLYSQVGLLTANVYEVVVNGNRLGYGDQGTLTVERASSSSQDDHLYANVKFVSKSDRFPSQRGTVRIEGHHPNSCLELDEIKWFSNGKDTISVLPILRMQNQLCSRVLVPFTYYFTVPEEIDYKSVLLHVRKMDGRSENYIYSIGQS